MPLPVIAHHRGRDRGLYDARLPHHDGAADVRAADRRRAAQLCCAGRRLQRRDGRRLTYVCIRLWPQDAAAASGPSASRMHGVDNTLISLMLGFSVALAAGQSLVRLPRLPGRHAGRRAARHRAAVRHLASCCRSPSGSNATQGGHHARRHLLRLAIWRLDHLDPDAHSGRSLVGDDLHRRLRDGQEGPRRRGALHRRGRLLDRRHLRRHRAHRGGAAARHARAAIRPAGIHRAAGARPDLPRLHVVDVAGAHAADGLHSGCCSA